MSLSNTCNLLGRAPTAASLQIGDVDGPASATDNAAARFDGTTGKLIQNSVFIISDNGDVIMPSTATVGLRLFNTVDQVTNTDVLHLKFSANVAQIQTTAGGSGTIRSMLIGPVGGYQLTLNPTGSASFSGQSISTPGWTSLALAYTNTATSGTEIAVAITPTYNQASGNAANTDLLVNRTQTAVGSGAQLLVDLQVSTVSKLAVNNIGTIATYNGVATAGWGLPAIQANGTIAATTNARSAAVATYTVGAADGSFVVSGNVLVTTSTTHSFSLDCSYTDESNVARVLVIPMAQLAGSFVATGLITNITGAGPYESASMTIRCKASTSITIRPSSGGTYTTVVYNTNANIRQIA